MGWGGGGGGVVVVAVEGGGGCYYIFCSHVESTIKRSKETRVAYGTSHRACM